MQCRLASRAWSCSDLLKGAAQLVDAMDARSADQVLLEFQKDLLDETENLSAEDIERLLQARSVIFKLTKCMIK